MYERHLTMTDQNDKLIDYLKDSIDNLASKFDKFLDKQESINDKVQENTHQISEHDRMIKEMQTSKEAKWAERHPVLAGGLNYFILICIFTLVAHFAPGIAHLIGSI